MEEASSVFNMKTGLWNSTVRIFPEIRLSWKTGRNPTTKEKRQGKRRVKERKVVGINVKQKEE